MSVCRCVANLATAAEWLPCRAQFDARHGLWIRAIDFASWARDGSRIFALGHAGHRTFARDGLLLGRRLLDRNASCGANLCHDAKNQADCMGPRSLLRA